MFEIEKGIPIPDPKTNRGAKWKSLVVNMQAGDSVVLDIPQEVQAFRMACSQWKLRHPELGMEWTSRKQADGRVRFWRVK